MEKAATMPALDLTPFRKRGSVILDAFVEQEATLIDLNKRLEEARIEGLRIKSQAFDTLCDIKLPAIIEPPEGEVEASPASHESEISYPDDDGDVAAVGQWKPKRKWGKHSPPTIAELHELLDSAKKAETKYRRSRSCEPSRPDDDIVAQLRTRDEEITRLKLEIERLRKLAPPDRIRTIDFEIDEDIAAGGPNLEPQRDSSPMIYPRTSSAPKTPPSPFHALKPLPALEKEPSTQTALADLKFYVCGTPTQPRTPEPSSVDCICGDPLTGPCDEPTEQPTSALSWLFSDKFSSFALFLNT